ncbi:MAG: lysoplasmalogenase [Lachnospiraceae bacterium]|nr:lysoplasmalogenase [Lachnospiraceae bacterium]
MEILKYVSLAVFILSTAVHLYASLKKDQKLRDLTKPFILLALLGFYCASASPVVLTVVLALLFSWLGDVLLMKNGTKWFTLGGIAFMVSHVFFILSYLKQTDFSAFRWQIAVLFFTLFIAASVIIFYYLRPHLPKKLFYPMLLYLIINGMMNCFAWFRSMTIKGAAGIITAVGALLFFVSDCSLFFVRFHKNSRLKTHFLVMLTYAVGEFLIVLGLVLG